MQPTPLPERFLSIVREIYIARSVERLLDWDQETVMPPKAAADRGEQLALMAGIAHDRLTSNELAEMLSALESDGAAGDDALAADVRAIRRDRDRAAALPRRLVEDLARATTLAKQAWAQARREARFDRFAPHLERILGLKREAADRIGWTTEPYDALLDEYEPDARAAEIAPLFARVKQFLVPLVAEIAQAPRRPDLSVLSRPCPVDAQAAFNRGLCAALGFDFDAGRIDTTVHPFCSGISPRDVRLTTRYDERYLPMSLFGTLHEAGHGLYEQGLDPAHANTPRAEAVSLGIHESQSRMWENQVGRSRAFWSHVLPRLHETFPAMRDVTLDAWHFAINAVRPSFIRVESDELTYGLHIILRFDLERRMLRGDLAVRDIPDAWNEGMRGLLGITPPDDAQGCLQDIHWSAGLLGYFPTYALGNLYAAQFFEAAACDLPDLLGAIGRGELIPLREWLRDKIHRHGRRYSAAQLVQRVTGAPLSPEPFLAYLRSKYRPLYGLARE